MTWHEAERMKLAGDLDPFEEHAREIATTAHSIRRMALSPRDLAARLEYIERCATVIADHLHNIAQESSHAATP